MAAFTKFNNFMKASWEGKHNLGAGGHTIVAQLMNTAPDQALDLIETDLPADLATGNGYTAGGVSVGTGTLSQSSGTAKLVVTDGVITASGGTIGPFRYVVLVNNTTANKDLIGFYDYGSSITLNDGEHIDLDFDGTNGVFTGV